MDQVVLDTDVPLHKNIPDAENRVEEPIDISLNDPSNVKVINLCIDPLESETIKLLARGCKFTPTPRAHSKDLRTDIKNYFILIPGTQAQVKKVQL